MGRGNKLSIVVYSLLLIALAGWLFVGDQSMRLMSNFIR